MTISNWFLLSHQLVVETVCDQFKLVHACCWNWLWWVQTVCYWLLKLAVTISNWFLLSHQLVVETACDQFKLVQACCWNWLWLFQTCCYWLLKLAVTSSNCFLLIVETGSNKVKPVVTHCAWQEGWFKLVLADYEDWLWLVQTGSYWLLKLFVTSSN